jgi:hypothetical protein
MCDRHTGLARILHRTCLKQDKDGFTRIAPYDELAVRGTRSNQDDASDNDQDRRDDPASGNYPPSGPPSNPSSSSSKGKDGSAFGQSGTSNENSGPSDSSDISLSNPAYDIDKDLDVYLQLNCDKVCISRH